MPETAGSAYLFCPAYPLADPGTVTRAVAAGQRFCDALGLRLVRSPLLTRHPGTGAWLSAAERQADFRAGSAHDWLLPARGGFGCLDLLAAPPARRPRLCGFSDITALHALWAVSGGPESLYGFLPGVAHGERAFTSAVALARGDGLTSTGHRTLRPGTAEGPLFAACLRVLTGLVGTPWMPSLAGRILALEDIDERPYQIDRDLWQLHSAGALRGIVGLVGGTFPAELASGYAGPSVAQVLTAWAERLGVPAISEIPFGHDADPLTLACGRMTRLDAGAEGRLVQASTRPNARS